MLRIELILSVFLQRVAPPSSTTKVALRRALRHKRFCVLLGIKRVVTGFLLPKANSGRFAVMGGRGGGAAYMRMDFGDLTRLPKRFEEHG